MRTLDEVIAMAEHCWQPMPESLCATCPSENKTSSCYLCADILYHLKKYQEKLNTRIFIPDGYTTVKIGDKNK